VSTKNVKNVRRWTEQFTRLGTTERAESLLAEFWDADADYYPVRKFPDAQPRHGLEQIAAFYLSYVETWGVYELSAVRIEPIDDVRLFLHTSVVAQGRDVRPRVEGDLYHSLWLRNGRILRCEDHLTESGALRGLGLTTLPPLP
jgi:hypothetical protein